MNFSTRRFLIFLVFACALGGLYAMLLDYSIRDEATIGSFMRGFFRGFIIGGIILSFEFILGKSRFGASLRRTSFTVSLTVRTVLTTGVIMGAVVLSRSLLARRGHSLEQWLTTGFIRDSAVILALALATHFILAVKRIIGGRVLVNFLLGRYNNPVDEERIFLFLDIADSTRMTQALGAKGAYALISRFFFDIADPIAKHGGEVHRYIGDEVVVTWPLNEGAKNAKCLRCLFAIEDTANQNAPRYKKDFGMTPEFRVGLHGGKVVAGECGDERQEIVYFGDTVNTAKRLEESCKDLHTTNLVSGDLLERINLPPDIELIDRGQITLRGRASSLRVSTVLPK